MNTTFSCHLGKDVGLQITVTSMTREHQLVKVWFDSACPLCAREIKIMRKLDWFNEVDFVDVLSTPDCPTQREHLLERFHAQRLGGPLLSGAAAFALLWRSLPLLRPLGEIARIPIILRALEIIYLKFLKIRPKLQAVLANRGP
jgi:predicted DCC family thiol-disulfide oxidoreductase YuxK